MCNYHAQNKIHSSKILLDFDLICTIHLVIWSQAEKRIKESYKFVMQWGFPYTAELLFNYSEFTEKSLKHELGSI